MIAISFFVPKLKKITKELFLIFMFLLLQLFCNAFASILEKFKVPNYFIYTVNAISSFILLCYLFYHLFIHAKGKLIISASIIIFMAFLIFSVLYTNAFHTYNSTISAVVSFIIAAFCLYFFYSRFVYDQPDEPVISQAIFWAVTGIFTYYTGSFFIFMTYQYLIETNSSLIGILWQFHNVLLLACCIYITYGIACKTYHKI